MDRQARMPDRRLAIAKRAHLTDRRVVCLTKKEAKTMRRRTVRVWLVVICFPLIAAQAQETTSRIIPFSLQTLLTPKTTQEVVVELWDAEIDGTLIFAESYTGKNALLVDSAGSI